MLYNLLADEIKKESNAELFQNYAGQALWHITRVLYSVYTDEEKLPLEQYVRLSHPEINKEEKEPTAQEIINDVLKKLG